MSEKFATARVSVIDQAKATLVAYGKKDWEAVRAALTQSAVYDEVATQRRVQGIDQIISAWQGWATALPDSKATVEHVDVSDNSVTLELTWRGTHTGPLQLSGKSIAPTGRTIELRACEIVQVEGGKTRSITHYFDMSTLLRQLGVSA